MNKKDHYIHTKIIIQRKGKRQPITVLVKCKTTIILQNEIIFSLWLVFISFQRLMKIDRNVPTEEHTKNLRHRSRSLHCILNTIVTL